MGMFDEIRCEAPLPDGAAPAEVWFQTKSFPDPCMCRYTITRDGRLIDSRGNDLEPEGYVIFYTLDEPASGDRQWREYRARFVAGRLKRIVRVADDAPGDRYYGLASFRWHDSPSFMFGDPDAEDV